VYDQLLCKFSVSFFYHVKGFGVLLPVLTKAVFCDVKITLIFIWYIVVYVTYICSPNVELRCI